MKHADAPSPTKERRYVVKMVVYARDLQEAAVKARFSEIVEATLVDEHVEHGVAKAGF